MTTIPSRSWTTQAGPSATAPVGGPAVKRQRVSPAGRGGAMKLSNSQRTLPSDQLAKGSAWTETDRPSSPTSDSVAGQPSAPRGNGSPTVHGCGDLVRVGLSRNNGSAEGAAGGSAPVLRLARAHRWGFVPVGARDLTGGTFRDL